MPVMIPSQRETVYKTTGRACPGPTAVVLHQIQTGVEVLTNQLAYCKRPLPTSPQYCHQSFHYALGNCQFVQFVPDADTAWGFHYIPTPVCPVPPCPVVQTCDGLGADQYNPDFDGNPPTPAVAAGPLPDLTANCSVIHFAVSMGSGINLCPPPNSKFYDCLVRALCYVFETNGLTPVSGSTLLTHIGELVDLDVDQLAIDIAACLSEPDPVLVECTCLPLVSDAPGNTTILLPDGVFTPAPAPVDFNVVALDTATANTTVTEAPANTWTVSVDVIDIPDGVLCAELNALPERAPELDDNDYYVGVGLGGTCFRSLQPTLCQRLAALADGGEAVPGVTELVGSDCNTYTLPIAGDVCASLQAFTTEVTFPVGAEVVAIDGENCIRVPLPDFQEPLLDCLGQPLVAGSQVAYASQVTSVDNGSTSLALGIMIPNVEPGCNFAGEILHPPACTDPSVQNTNFNGELYIGADDLIPGGLAWKSRFSDPVLHTGGNGVIDLQAQRSLGKNVIIIDNGGSVGTTTLTNPPIGCADKHLYIKNIGTAIENIASANLIDGQATISLDPIVVTGYPFGNNGGESVHLVWSDTNSTWYVL